MNEGGGARDADFPGGSGDPGAKVCVKVVRRLGEPAWSYGKGNEASCVWEGENRRGSLWYLEMKAVVMAGNIRTPGGLLGEFLSAPGHKWGRNYSAGIRRRRSRKKNRHEKSYLT